MTWVDQVFGHGKDLDAMQMTARAGVLFIITLVLVRTCGMRAFGRKSSFDTIIVIMLGAVLSRAVVGASAAISRADLDEAVRSQANRHDVLDVREIHLESSGELTVIDPETEAAAVPRVSMPIRAGRLP